METTIIICKTLNVIRRIGNMASVVSLKIGQFESVINKLESVTITGIMKPSKFEKFEKKLIASGFQVSKVDWKTNMNFEEKEAFEYKVQYIKVPK